MGTLGSMMQRLHAPIYASRLRELVRRITPHLREGDRVLDVGCGFGALGRALLDSERCPAGVQIRGLERRRRGGEMIEVSAYDGVRFPLEDDALDVVILADVLHHEEDPDRLLGESRRVARRLVIVKDHAREGIFAQQRLALIDWAANAPYAVPCLYRYHRCDQWREAQRRCGLRLAHETTSMTLYPPLVNLLFGRRLQYLAILETSLDYA